MDNADAATHDTHKSEDRDGDFAILLVLVKVKYIVIICTRSEYKVTPPRRRKG